MCPVVWNPDTCPNDQTYSNSYKAANTGHNTS